MFNFWRFYSLKKWEDLRKPTCHLNIGLVIFNMFLVVNKFHKKTKTNIELIQLKSKIAWQWVAPPLQFSPTPFHNSSAVCRRLLVAAIVNLRLFSRHFAARYIGGFLYFVCCSTRSALMMRQSVSFSSN